MRTVRVNAAHSCSRLLLLAGLAVLLVGGADGCRGKKHEQQSKEMGGAPNAPAERQAPTSMPAGETERGLPMPTTAPAADPPAADTPSPTTAPAAQSSKGRVSVDLSESSIEMPRQLPAGATTLSIKNTGQFPHNIRIKGPGLDVTLPAEVAPGQSTTLQVQLAPGHYEVWCPAPGNEECGTRYPLEVTP